MSSPKSSGNNASPMQDESYNADKISLEEHETALSEGLVEAIEEDVSEAADSHTIQQEAEPDKVYQDKADGKSIEVQIVSDEQPEDESSVDDPEVEKAIEEIAVIEDINQENKDQELEDSPVREPKPVKPESEISLFIKKLWSNPRNRFIAIGGVSFALLVVGLTPTSRYFVLNAARVRSSVELRVIDSSTLQPLKNVTVKAANATAQTDSDGVAKLEGVLLGRTKLQIEKRAYASQEQTLTIGWGSNPLGEYKAVPIGSQYTFYVRDFASGKPISRAEASSGEGNASSDEEGKLVLALDTAGMDDKAQVSVAISADGYRKETMNITVNNKEVQSIEMVPARKHVFVSKRSGKYDVYSIDVDGKNERRIVGGSGYERDDITLLPHPTDGYAAYVATRENTRNQSGYLLSTIYILDVESGDLMRIDQSEQIQVVGWSSAGRLVYVKIAAGASGTDPKRHRLMSFNNEDHTDVKELASSNAFNDVMLVDDQVYYAPSNIFQEAEPAIYSVKSDGKGEQKILDKEIFSIIRTSYDTLHLSTGNDWYEYVLGSPLASNTSAPGSQTNHLYVDSPDRSRSFWIDSRDGKGVMLGYSKESDKESVLAGEGGLKLPAYWLNNSYIVYRISNGRETADYLMNIFGGESRKIIDTTATSGISRWFYY